MDIDYLLFLQDLREGPFAFLDSFCQEISNFLSTFWIFTILAFFYWQVDQKKGLQFLTTFTLSRYLLNIIKVFVCAYRPWIREPRLKPDGDILKEATGYSFPSGHTVTAATFFGNFGAWLWNKRRWISICMWFLLLSLAFSRNFLSVHTPQDVLAALILGLACVAIGNKLMHFLDNCDFKKSVIVLCTCLIVSGVLLFVVTVKPYPMDYEDGKLLVEPVSMISNAYTGTGELFGLIIGWFIVKNFVHYKIQRKSKAALLVSIIALIPLFYWDAFFKLIFKPLGILWSALMIRMLKIIYIVAFIPFILQITNKKSKKLKEF